MIVCCPKCASSEKRSIEAIYCDCRTPQKPRPSAIEALARESAPPEPRNTSFWLALTVSFAVLSSVTRGPLGETTVALAACAMLSGWMAREALRYNRTDLPRLLDYWHRSFMCTRCGEIYVPA